jgi:hypothetical protein
MASKSKNATAMPTADPYRGLSDKKLQEAMLRLKIQQSSPFPQPIYRSKDGGVMERTPDPNRSTAEKATSPLYIGAAKQLGIKEISGVDELRRIEAHIAGGNAVAPPAAAAPPPRPAQEAPFAQSPVDAASELVRQQLEANQQQQTLYAQMQQDLLARMNAAQSLAATSGSLRATVNGEAINLNAPAELSGLEIKKTEASGTLPKPSKFLQDLAITTPGAGLNLTI